MYTEDKEYSTRIYKNDNGYCLTRLALGIRVTLYLEGEELERPDLEEYIAITAAKLDKLAHVAHVVYNATLKLGRSLSCEVDSEGKYVIYYTVPDTSNRLGLAYQQYKNPGSMLDILLDKGNLEMPAILKGLMHRRFNTDCYMLLEKKGCGYAKEMLSKHYYKNILLVNELGKREIEVNFNN